MKDIMGLVNKEMKKTENGCLDLPADKKPSLRWKKERDMIQKHLQELFLAGVKWNY